MSVAGFTLFLLHKRELKSWGAVMITAPGAEQTEMTEPIESPAKPESLVKSKKRVEDHGEVFTPSWLVDRMIGLVKDESERIDSRFLEPACGSGNFLTQVLETKLRVASDRYKKSEFEHQNHALLSLMSIYGIELLEDNVYECRQNMLDVFSEKLKLETDSDLYRAGHKVLEANIVHGDALSMQTSSGKPIAFAEWGYLGRGKFQRRDFLLDVMTQLSTFTDEGTLFAHLGKHEIFTPSKNYQTMTIAEIGS
jgi:hypothetical protein